MTTKQWVLILVANLIGSPILLLASILSWGYGGYALDNYRDQHEYVKKDQTKMIVDGDVVWSRFYKMDKKNPEYVWKKILRLNSGKYMMIGRKRDTRSVERIKVWECQEALGYSDAKDLKELKKWRSIFRNWESTDQTEEYRIKNLVKLGEVLIKDKNEYIR